MLELATTYSATVAALGAIATLMLLQVIVNDVVGIAKQHVPGTPVEPNHGLLLFRAGRVVANTNESIAVFICTALFCVFSSASPVVAGYAAWAFVATRTLYAFAYYTNRPKLRSGSFALSLLALAVMIGAGVAA